MFLISGSYFFGLAFLTETKKYFFFCSQFSGEISFFMNFFLVWGQINVIYFYFVHVTIHSLYKNLEICSIFFTTPNISNTLTYRSHVTSANGQSPVVLNSFFFFGKILVVVEPWVWKHMDFNRNYSIKDISLIINSNVGMKYSVLSHAFRIRTFLLYLVHISKMLLASKSS